MFLRRSSYARGTVKLVRTEILLGYILLSHAPDLHDTASLASVANGHSTLALESYVTLNLQ